VTEDQPAGPPRLWISYPWTDEEVVDFAYLVPQLKEAGIEAVYESLQVERGTELPERIVQRLQSIGFDGWLYVLTHQLLARKSCADAFIAAIEQTQRKMGPHFPMIGLLHGVAAQQVPAVVRVHPCLHVADPDWKDRIARALVHRKPAREPGSPKPDARFLWKIHTCYGGDPMLTAVEVSTREHMIQYWRIAIPKAAHAVRWGVGPAGGGAISPVRFAVARGTGRCEGHDVSWFGAANGVSTADSAYVVFSGPLPEFVCFGPAEDPSGPPGQLEVHRTTLQ
jgi:hypothetical protein